MLSLYDAINHHKSPGQHHFHLGHGRAAYADDDFAPHKMTGVDKLHKKGILGAGALVCVLDTGVDYKLPALGGCYGSNCHVKVGHDFVGDDGKHPGINPFAQCQSHGTHVSGIIGALPNKDGFTGVAPEADIGMYRLFPCKGAAAVDVIIQGLIAAATSNCDVINMSLGGGSAFSEADVMERLIDRLEARGIVVEIAAGNGGEAGLFTTSSPALSSGGTSVGSVNVESCPAFRLDLEDGGSIKTIPYLASARYNSTAPLPLVALSYDTELSSIGAACEPIPASIDCKGAIVITQRGLCPLLQKVQNVAAAGALVIVLYTANSSKPFTIYDSEELPLFPIVMTAEFVIPLLKALKANPHMKASLSGELPESNHDIVDNLTGGLVSGFSAMGPSADMLLQSAFCAPGGNILSTFPSTDGGIGIDSGTSMATPFAAGAAALLLAGRRSEKLTPAQIKSLLVTTAKPLSVTRNSSDLVSTLRQGGGLIQVDKAFEAKTFFSPLALSLNDTAHPHLTHEIEITNTNEFDVTYTFGSRSAQSLAAYNNSAIEDVLPAETPVPVDGAAEVLFQVPVLRVLAGQTGKIVVNFRTPVFSKENLAQLPFYGGYVTIQSDECTHINYSIPYFGLGSRLIKMPVVDTTSTFTALALGDDGTTEQDYSSLNLPLLSTNNIELKVQVPQTDPKKVVMYHRAAGVALQFRFAGPSRMVTVDLVHANTTFKANLPRRVRQTPTAGLVLEDLNPITMHFGEDADDDDDEVPGSPSCPALSNAQVIGRIQTAVDVPRDLPDSGDGPATSITLVFQGKVSETLDPDDEKTLTSVPAHTPYRMLLRALKLTADPKYECSWESWLSPSFAFSD
ncbi:BZ3500_MvSof-1268-A1-R1_Chr4-1g06718 [Microbotryum saponariae]|uniref:BZ3500_MvSof-1268-A1-R1_Chr4-1g06718 protein n=1 Tax=Microbotryum saponariae TaxID=289078 RepID=A0A2X0M351_9BASI|nr:BZ3500_MvSof-1268-A1-R1_Chr4-1g06718 [Microbotryum saponariae]SDA06383.1 BZ3501_MvSof-1269-A2-R1_Chr4-1g06428 [Microbotryum saponariae]